MKCFLFFAENVCEFDSSFLIFHLCNDSSEYDRGAIQVAHYEMKLPDPPDLQHVSVEEEREDT